MKINLAEEYKALHAAKKFKGTTILNYIKPLEEMFEHHDVETVLDYGCGLALPYKSETMGLNFPLIEFTLYDPYVPEHSVIEPTDFKYHYFDAVICIDVLEHIPEEELKEVLDKIFSHALVCAFFTFCNRPARKTFSDGSNVHVTQRPREWWEKKIDESNDNDIPVVLMETP